MTTRDFFRVCKQLKFNINPKLKNKLFCPKYPILKNSQRLNLKKNIANENLFFIP
jgi:hypothetical protein